MTAAVKAMKAGFSAVQSVGEHLSTGALDAQVVRAVYLKESSVASRGTNDEDEVADRCSL